MARSRADLHEILTAITPKVYFQPPADIEMEFPAIVYQRDPADTRYADNSPYQYTKRYQITVIARDPDSPISDAVALLPMCTHNRFFVANNMNHDVFTLFF